MLSSNRFNFSFLHFIVYVNQVYYYYDLFRLSHVSIAFQCILTRMSLLRLLVWGTKVRIRPRGWWMYRLQRGNIEGIRAGAVVEKDGQVEGLGGLVQVEEKR